MAEQWIKSNLKVIEDEDYKMIIDWKNGIFTPLNTFIDLFGEIIIQAINENKDVKQSIAESDNGRGYAKLILH